MSGQWISVDDRMPERSGYYLTTHLRRGQFDKSPIVSQAWFNPDSIESKWWAGRGYIDSPLQHNNPIHEVTHWMPMPEYPGTPDPSAALVEALSVALSVEVTEDAEDDRINDEAPSCRRCGDPYRLRDGSEPTPECDPCAHEVLALARADLAAHAEAT